MSVCLIKSVTSFKKTNLQKTKKAPHVLTIFLKSLAEND